MCERTKFNNNSFTFLKLSFDMFLDSKGTLACFVQNTRSILSIFHKEELNAIFIRTGKFGSPSDRSSSLTRKTKQINNFISVLVASKRACIPIMIAKKTMSKTMGLYLSTVIMTTNMK